MLTLINKTIKTIGIILALLFRTTLKKGVRSQKV